MRIFEGSSLPYLNNTEQYRTQQTAYSNTDKQQIAVIRAGKCPAAALPGNFGKNCSQEIFCISQEIFLLIAYFSLDIHLEDYS